MKSEINLKARPYHAPVRRRQRCSALGVSLAAIVLLAAHVHPACADGHNSGGHHRAHRRRSHLTKANLLAPLEAARQQAGNAVTTATTAPINGSSPAARALPSAANTKSTQANAAAEGTPAAAAAGGAAAAPSAGDLGGLPSDEEDPGVAYRQLLARKPGGNVTYSPTLNMNLPQPWDIVNLTQILVDNMEPVVQFWKEQVPHRPTVRDLFAAAARTEWFRQTDTHRLVVIRNNEVIFPLMPAGLKQRLCGHECNPQLIAWLDAMRAAVEVYGLQLPDVVFLLNVQDGGGLCVRTQLSERPECTAPALALSQFELSADILAPQMLLPDANVTFRHAPWSAKRPAAFFRGVPSCGELRYENVCSRTLISRLAQLYPEMFDAGLIEPYLQRPEEMEEDPILSDGRGPLPVKQRAPRSALARHKYLLNLDGHSAAYRFAMLLGVNSLVLKQTSRQVEWFYNSAKPFVHYLPILDSREDVLERIKWAEAHPEEVGRIVQAGNRFALTYTTYYARILYWIYALHAYKGIFPDQDEFFATRGAGVRDLVNEYWEREKVREQAAQAAAEKAAGGEAKPTR